MKRLYAGLIVLVALAVLSPVSALAGGVPWQEPINTIDRFIVLTSYQNNAVFDAETGLVWQRSPDTGADNWINQQFRCIIKTIGNRSGWRVPTLEELQSLVDNTQTNPRLPPGHPFTNVGSFYWSATTSAFDATQAWGVWFSIAALPQVFTKSGSASVWCVRGGQGVNAQ